MNSIPFDVNANGNGKVQKGTQKQKSTSENEKSDSKTAKTARLTIICLGLLVYSCYTQSALSIARLKLSQYESQVTPFQGVSANKNISTSSENSGRSLATTSAHRQQQPREWIMETDFIPLRELVRFDENVSCRSDDFFVAPIVSNETADNPYLTGRRIPMAVHMTGETKCLTKAYHKNALAWSFPEHSFYFHDKMSRLRLFQKYWPMFPELQIAWHCFKHKGGAAIADVWRYLAIYEYGGIYTDMDNAPAEKFLQGKFIPPDADAWFLRSHKGYLSQYFFAASPRHPIMYLTLRLCLEELIHDVADAGDWYVPGITGPHAIKRAFEEFAKMTGKDVQQGTYQGKGVWAAENRTVTVFGMWEKGVNAHNDYVYREAPWLRRKTRSEGWTKMGFTNYQFLNRKIGKSCEEVIYENQKREQGRIDRRRNERFQYHLGPPVQEPMMQAVASPKETEKTIAHKQQVEMQAQVDMESEGAAGSPAEGEPSGEEQLLQSEKEQPKAPEEDNKAMKEPPLQEEEQTFEGEQQLPQQEDQHLSEGEVSKPEGEPSSQEEEIKLTKTTTGGNKTDQNLTLFPEEHKMK